VSDVPPPDAFYVETDDGFDSTAATRGPWSPTHQHAGPPSALLGRAIERCPGLENPFVGRITFEILGPVPIAPLTVSAEVVRGGRSVELLEASLADSDGRPVMRARSWRLRRAAIDLPADVPGSDDPPPPPPERGTPIGGPPGVRDVGWHAALEFSAVAGSFTEPGPATVWMRPRIPLVAGEDWTPLTRVLVAADAGNGISAALSWDDYSFINTDLSVHLHREPAGEWVALESVTRVSAEGVGMADTKLHDERGPIGRAAQTLLIAPRERVMPR
jgi:hypothetical protein